MNLEWAVEQCVPGAGWFCALPSVTLSLFAQDTDTDADADTDTDTDKGTEMDIDKGTGQRHRDRDMRRYTDTDKGTEMDIDKGTGNGTETETCADTQTRTKAQRWT